MIAANDLYNVLTAVAPLYVAMGLAYGSVKWWRIFTPDQCAGINRFVALFAVPLLSFHFISTNDPYAMNCRLLAADVLQKLTVLAALVVWAKASAGGCLEWAVTLFSLATLPNTLVMGIPLLKGMYGPASGTLMVQIVALQCIVWYTLALFLFEFRGARLLILQQFPDTAGSIVSFRVESDVLSLDGKEPLQTEAEVGADGRLHVTVRKSTSSRSEARSRVLKSGVSVATPRPSDLSSAEIYSLQSSRNPTPRSSNFSHADFHALVNGRVKTGASASPRQSNFRSSVLDDEGRVGARENGLVTMPLASAGGALLPVDELRKKANEVDVEAGKDLHVFVWSSSSSPAPSEGSWNHAFADEHGVITHAADHNYKEANHDGYDDCGRKRKDFTFMNRIQTAGSKDEHHPNSDAANCAASMLPADVMTRLVLIMVWRKLTRNPNTYSSLLGVVWSLVSFRWGIEMPVMIARSISILSDAGLGMAMFSLGLFMALQPRIVACGNSVAALAMAMRFVAGPAVMAAASIAVGLRGVLLYIAIVQAALPQGIVPFVFAKEYNVHPDILSTGVIFGMLIALPVTLVYYVVLGL